MKINLTQIKFKPTIAGPEVTEDLHKEVAETIYQSAMTLAAHSLALRLYESDGEIEVSDEERKIIKDAIPKGFRYFAQAALLRAIGE